MHAWPNPNIVQLVLLVGEEFLNIHKFQVMVKSTCIAQSRIHKIILLKCFLDCPKHHWQTNSGEDEKKKYTSTDHFFLRGNIGILLSCMSFVRFWFHLKILHLTGIGWRSLANELSVCIWIWLFFNDFDVGSPVGEVILVLLLSFSYITCCWDYTSSSNVSIIFIHFIQMLDISL